MEFIAKATLIAEGAHGSLTKILAKHFDLRKDSDPQTYGMGVKEVWQVDPEKWRPGKSYIPLDGLWIIEPTEAVGYIIRRTVLSV